MSSFSTGVYMNYTISGNVLITITKTGGANAVLSGLFFDPPPAPSAVIWGGGSSTGGLGDTTGVPTQLATDPIAVLDPPSAPQSSSATTAGLSAHGAALNSINVTRSGNGPAIVLPPAGNPTTDLSLAPLVFDSPDFWDGLRFKKRPRSI
jgi:hypothetical protein